jgi:hypothetical protein
MGCSHQKEAAEELIKEIHNLRTKLNNTRSSLVIQSQTTEDRAETTLRAENCNKDQQILELVDTLAEQQASREELNRLNDEFSAAKGQLDQLKAVKHQNLFEENKNQQAELPADRPMLMGKQPQESLQGSTTSYTKAKVLELVLTYENALQTIETQKTQIDRLKLEFKEVQEIGKTEKQESRRLLLNQETCYQAELLRLCKLIDTLKTKLTRHKHTSSADFDSEANHTIAKSVLGENSLMSGCWDQLEERKSLTTQEATDFSQRSPDEEIEAVEQRKDSTTDRSETHEEKMMKSQSTETRTNTVTESKRTARRQKGARRFK